MMAPRQYRHEVIPVILFFDPIGNLQLLGALGAWVRGLWTLMYKPEIWNPSSAYVFFHYFPEWLWAMLLIIVGSVQWWAAGTRRWRAQFWSANLQAGMLVYSLVINSLTNPGGTGLPYSIVFLVMQIHVSMRVVHDKELTEVLDAQKAASGEHRRTNG